MQVRIRNDGVDLRQLLLAVEHEDEAQREDACHVHTQWDQEHEEVAVVTTSYAVVYPWTVMVKCLQMPQQISDIKQLNLHRTMVNLTN